MSKKEGGNVVSLPTACTAEGCKKRPEVAGFCDEHFMWFKEGMITKEGKKPVDFEKKFINFVKRKQKKAA